MAANEIYVDLDGGTINNLINWRHNPLSTSERTSLGVTLNASNVGLFVFDTTLLQGFYWSGTAWVGEGISSVAWGGITGTLSNQTDLQNVLNLKANISNLSEVAFTGNYNDLIDKPSFISNADDGLTLDGDTVILGGTTLTDKVIDMSINGNQFWFKTKLEDDGGFYRVIIGDLDTDPWNSHSGLLISKSENDDGNRCNFLTMTTGDVSLNGWFFINYQDVTGECLPNLRVVSNASAGNAAAFNLDLAGRDSHSDFSQFSVFYYDYDEYVVSGNQAGPMLNSNLITFVNGSGGTPSTAVSFFWVDNNYNWMIGKNGFADRPLGALQIGDNSATYGIYQKGAASANWLAGNLTIGGSPNVAVNALEVVGDAKISALAGTGTTMVVADSTGLLHTQSIPTSPVTSVFGRTGAVTAQNSDYSAFYYPLTSNPAGYLTLVSLGNSQIGFGAAGVLSGSNNLTWDNGNNTITVKTPTTVNTVYPSFIAQNTGSASSGNSQYGGAYYSVGMSFSGSTKEAGIRWYNRAAGGASQENRLVFESNTNGGSYAQFAYISDTLGYLGVNGMFTGILTANQILSAQGQFGGSLVAPLLIEANTLLVSPLPTAIENDGTHLYYTNGSSIRLQLDNDPNSLHISGTTNPIVATAGVLSLAVSAVSGNLLKVLSDGLYASGITGVSSVSNLDGSLNISPTTGAVISSLNTAHANIWTATQTINKTALGTSNADGLLLENTTAAASSAQQISPSLTLLGQGWKTTATAASESVAFSQYVLPVQGTTSAGGQWILASSVSGSTLVNALTVDLGIGDGNAFLGIGKQTAPVAPIDVLYTVSTINTDLMLARFQGQNSLGGGNRNTFIKFGGSAGDGSYYDFVNDGGGIFYLRYGNSTTAIGGTYVFSAVNDGRFSITTSLNIGGAATYASSNAVLSLVSTTRGFLPPVMTTTQKNAISPTEGLITYDTVLHTLSIYDSTTWLAAGHLAGSASSGVTGVTAFTVAIGSTLPNNTYKVNITPTSSLSAALFYVSAKTTTTFTVTYLSALTGTVTFDWCLFP